MTDEPNIFRARMAETKDSVIESICSKSEGWTKQVRTGRQGVLLDDLPELLVALGLKVVDVHDISISPDLLVAYRTLAKQHFSDGEIK